MDLIMQYIFSFVTSIFIAFGVIIYFCLSERKQKPQPDYYNVIPVIEIVQALQKICPIGCQSKWILFPFDHGCHRCWSQFLSLPFLQNSINLYGSAAKVNSTSESICSLIANVTNWPEWNPFFTSQYIVKSFHDKSLRRDHFMEAERVVSIVRETNKIQSHAIMYRFHHFSDSKVGWILFWNPKRLEFSYFLIQPTKDKKENSVCLLTHIMGTESNIAAASVSLVSQRLRNIQDTLRLSSLCPVISLHSSQKESSFDEQSHHLSSRNQECSFSLSSKSLKKGGAQNTKFILVPFVQTICQFWKVTVDYKLAVKNIEPVLQKQTSLAATSKKNEADHNSLRRAVSDVGVSLKTDNTDLSSSADNSTNSAVSKIKHQSELKSRKSKTSKQKSGSISEDSDTKNVSSQEKVHSKAKLRSLSETAIDLTSLKCSSELVRAETESDHESFSKLEDVSEIAEEKLLALDKDETIEMFNSSVSEDFEVVEEYEFTENRMASFMTQGNYGAAELQAEVLIASQFLHDMHSGNYQSIGGWTFNSYYKSLCVLRKTTCSKFLTISSCSILCQTEIPVPPKDVWKLVKCPQFRFICDEYVKSVEVVEKISHSQKIIYIYHEVSGFVKKEMLDFCLLQTEREEVDKYYSCFCSIEYDKCPLIDGVTRGTMRPSGWIVEKVNNDPHKSIVTYMVQSLVSNPGSLFIQELSTMVPQSLHNLKNYIVSKPV